MNETLEQLFGILLSKTEADAIRWDEVDEGIYRTQVGQELIRITREESKYEDDDGSFPDHYRIAIVNTDGRVVEEIYFHHRHKMYEIINRLYVAARRSALGTEDILRRMLLKLNK